MIVGQIAEALAAAQAHHHVNPETLHPSDRKALMVAISRTLGEPQDVLNEVAIRTMHTLLHQRAQLERIAQAERDEAAKRAAAEAMRDQEDIAAVVAHVEQNLEAGGVLQKVTAPEVAPVEPGGEPDDAAVEASFAKSPPGTPTPIYEFTAPANSKPFTAKVD